MGGGGGGGETFYNIKQIYLACVIMSFILVTTLFYEALQLILQGKIRCWQEPINADHSVAKRVN